MWIYFAIYIVGVLIAFGIVGEPRDEMDGILDVFCIFVWPVVLPCWVVYRVAAMIVQIGIIIKRNT